MSHNDLKRVQELREQARKKFIAANNLSTIPARNARRAADMRNEAEELENHADDLEKEIQIGEPVK